MTRNFATIGAVYDDGVTLIFDGEGAPTDKHYLCNTSVEFHAGDRVRIVECDGTYIVEYVVGPPGSGGGGSGLPPAADAVVDQNTKTAYTQNKIYFRYYQSKFWARYGEYGSWVQLN